MVWRNPSLRPRLEVFFVDRPLDGFGAVEINARPESD
jgi:hypothetical protein